MAHVTPLAPEAVPEFAERFAHYARTRGFIPNSIRTMARRPAIAAAFMALNQAVLYEGTVPEELKMLVSLIASQAAGCQDAEGLKNFDQAENLAPDDEEFLFSRAEILKKIGILHQRRELIDSAVQVLNRIVELNRNNAEAWNSLGICTKELGKEKLSAQYFEKSRELIKLGTNKKKTRDLDALV